MRASVCVSVCIYASLVDQWKTPGDKPVIFHHLVGHKNPSDDVFDDVVARDIDLLFEGQYLNRDFR